MWDRDIQPSDISQSQCYEVTTPKDCSTNWVWMLAEKCAADFHDNHDGWEYSRWPNDDLLFIIFDENMKLVGKFNVYLEFEPSFSATEVY
jgi:hypothetical protein